MEKYSFKCTPKEFDLERIARENAKDGNLAFLVIIPDVVFVGIKEGIQGFPGRSRAMSCNGYHINPFSKKVINTLIGNIEKVISIHKKKQKQTYKVLTWK